MAVEYAVLLVRVSTMGQDNAPQIEDLKKFAKSKGYSKLKIIETKESGLVDLDKKVGSNGLFSFIKENPKYRVVFATEISRIGRRQSILHQIKEWFIKHSIQLHVKDIGYSLLDENGKVTPAGDMMFSLYGIFAEAEIKQKKDRFSRARKHLMESGLSISGKTLFGYQRVSLDDVKRTTFILHDENANVVRTVFNWYNNGIDVYEKKVSIKRIALECMKLGFPKYTHSKRNVNKLLKEEGYTGEKITNNRRKNQNYEEGSSDEKYYITNNKIKYPIIIDRETFDLAQQRLKENNSRVDKSTTNITILSQIIKCSKCDSHYSGNYRVVKGRIVNNYRCSSRSGTNFCGNTQSISMIMLDSAIWSLIKTDFYTLSKVISSYNPDLEIIQLKKSLTVLEKRVVEIDQELVSLNQSLKAYHNQKSLSLNKFLETIETKAIKLDKEKNNLENEISKIKVNLLSNSVDFSQLFKSIKPNLDLIEESKELLKKYINLFVDELEITLHNTRFSIIKVKFKINSRSMVDFGAVKLVKGVTPVFEIESTTTIILDKRNPQLIKSYKTIYPIKSIGKSDSITIIQNESKRASINPVLSLDELESKKNKKYLSRFLYKRLEVY